MRDDLQKMIEFKDELEKYIEEQNKEIEEKNLKLDELVDALNQRELEDNSKSNYINDIERQLKDTLSKSKNFEQKLKQMK